MYRYKGKKHKTGKGALAPVCCQPCLGAVQRLHEVMLICTEDGAKVRDDSMLGADEPTVRSSWVAQRDQLRRGAPPARRPHATQLTRCPARCVLRLRQPACRELCSGHRGWWVRWMACVRRGCARFAGGGCGLACVRRVCARCSKFCPCCATRRSCCSSPPRG